MSSKPVPTWMRIPQAVAASATLDHAPFGVLLVDGEGFIGYANQRVERLLNWPGSELAGQKIGLLASFWTQENWVQTVWPKLRNQPALAVMGGWQRRGDGILMLEAHLVRLQIAGQELASVYLLPGSDGPPGDPAKGEGNTEVFDLLSAGICWLDPDLTIRRTNPAFSNLVGTDSRELVGQPVAKVLPPEPGQESRWSQIPSLGLQDWAFTFRNRRGRLCHLVVSSRPHSVSADNRGRNSTPAGTDGAQGYRVMVEDLSEHEQLKLLVAEHEHSFEHLAANMPGMIYKFVMTRDGQSSFPYASPGCKDLWEIDPVLVRQDASPIVKLIHPDDLPAFQQSVMKSAMELSAWEFEGRMITPSGKLKWWHAASRPELAENGEIVWQGLLMDITHQKQIEEELKVARVRAESAALAKANFLANMSHEIRTPMNGVIGMTELLGATDLNARQQHYVETIRSSAEVLLTIINDVLDMSKMEAGKLALHAGIFDFRRMLEDVAALLAARAFEKGLELIVRYDPRTPSRFKGDAIRIRQILTNLIGNAIKFTARGYVLVEVESLAPSGDRASLRVSVKDTGIGISPDAIKRLFQKFEQADSSTSRRFGGTGLGLAISKQLVELMGGRMEVESELERGSTFRFFLELPTHEPVPGEEVVPPDLTRMRVLAVDDHPVNLEMLKEIFEAWGVPHAEAASGEAALKALRQAVRDQAPFDVVLLDYHMPGMDGLFLATAIRAEPEISNVQIVLFSSSSFSDDQQRKLAEAGVSAHLFKPLRQFELRQVLSQVSPQHVASAAPAPPAPAPDKAAEAARGFEVLAGQRVLLAEDNEVNREVAVEMLQSLGCAVDCAANGIEAVALARRHRYPLIFMDCQMPDMDGFDAAKVIRQFETPPAAIIIAMTAHAMAGDRERCLEAGMDDHLAKPVTFAELRQRVLGYSQRLAAFLVGNPPAPPRGVSSPPASEAAERSHPEPGRAWALFDVEAGLAVTGGRRETLRKAIKIWWQKVPGWLTELKVAIQRGDSVLIRRTAHTIRGAAGSIGAIAIQHRAECLETQADPNSLAGVANLFDQLVTDMERLRQMTGAFEDEAPSPSAGEKADLPDL